KAEELPELDMVLISHGHYDHLDYETIKKIDSKVKKYCVPLGVESYLEGWGVDSDKINSMSWYDDAEVDGLSVNLVPAQHYSSRNINDSNTTWWGGFLLKDEYHSFYYTGDSGYGDFFKDIHERYGDVELMMADSGQYDEMWPYCHMNPSESLKSAEDMNAEWLIPVHWAGFVLANHPWYEPGEEITQLAEQSIVSVATPAIGEIVDYKELNKENDKWWEELE
ncbi:MAG: MBL fold metallo-hydrolase, partial [Clostridium sp.]|nr:MBL fold metallo-hydrolase [Clostridium sp.]